MYAIDRRQFLKTALAATAPLAFARPARAIDPIARKHPSHLKLSIAAYSFRDSLLPKSGKPTTRQLNLDAQQHVSPASPSTGATTSPSALPILSPPPPPSTPSPAPSGTTP